MPGIDRLLVQSDSEDCFEKALPLFSSEMLEDGLWNTDGICFLLDSEVSSIILERLCNNC